MFSYIERKPSKVCFPETDLICLIRLVPVVFTFLPRIELLSEEKMAGNFQAMASVIGHLGRFCVSALRTALQERWAFPGLDTVGQRLCHTERVLKGDARLHSW